MITTELIPIREQLERIEKKLDGNFKNKFLSINKVSKLTSLSPSTIRRLNAGFHTKIWDGRDNQGREVPTGNYFYSIEAGDFRQTKKMILLK